MLWDLGLKVGHATRTVNETLKAARERHDGPHGAARGAAPLRRRGALRGAARRASTRRWWPARRASSSPPSSPSATRGTPAPAPRATWSSRNVKEGKGGQRDLQTLFWIAKYYYRVASNEALVDAGLLSRERIRGCSAAATISSGRCAATCISSPGARRSASPSTCSRSSPRRLGYQRHPGLEAAERFMKHYFLVAKDVGDLTRIVCAELEDREAKNVPRLNRLLRGFRARPKKLKGSRDFLVEHGRINVADDDVFERDPVNLIRIFHEAGRNDLAFHPDAHAADHEVAEARRPRAAARRGSEPAVPGDPLRRPTRPRRCCGT